MGLMTARIVMNTMCGAERGAGGWMRRGRLLLRCPSSLIEATITNGPGACQIPGVKPFNGSGPRMSHKD